MDEPSLDLVHLTWPAIVIINLVIMIDIMITRCEVDPDGWASCNGCLPRKPTDSGCADRGPCVRGSLGFASDVMIVIATATDFAVGIHRKAAEPLWGAASGVTWLILNFYVPLLMVSLPILVWQLCARSGEPFSARAAHRKTAATASGQNSA
jgi:hypothetical protein